MDHERALNEIATGPTGPEVGAFFDFDGTLIAGYSAAAFAEAQLRRLNVSPLEVADLVRAWLDVSLQRAEEETLVATAVRSFGGYEESDVRELSERLFVDRIAGSVHPEARALVRAQDHAQQSRPSGRVAFDSGRRPPVPD